MEQCNNCASCEHLTALVQKFQTKFTLYKQKNLQNDENLNTFKRQNKLLASLQEELLEKNVSLAECQKKLKSLQVDCSALRLTLEKEKEDNEKQLTTKFKDSDQELQRLRNELETIKTKLLAQQINNNQLILKLEQEAKAKADLEESFAKEKKELLEKIAKAENLTATFNRSLTLWSGLMDNRPALTRLVVRYIKKWERRSEAAMLEANLLNDADPFELDLKDGSLDNESEASPITSPKKMKREGSCSATDPSDDDFEEVAISKSPVKLLPVGSVSGQVSRPTETDQLFTNELGTDEVSHTSPSKLNSGSNSRSNVSQKPTSPWKDSSRKAISGKNSEIVKEMKSIHVQTETEVRHTGCDPVDSDDVREVRTEDRVLASVWEDFDLHCDRLSPFGDNCLFGSESTSGPMVVVSSKPSHSALCHVCDSLLSKCTPCQSVFQELSEFKKSKETLRNGCESPPRETCRDQEEERSLFSPVRHPGRDSCDTGILELPSLEEDLSLNFGDTPAQVVKLDVSLQTSPRRTHVKTQTVKILSRTVGCQSEVVHTSDKAARPVVDTESRATQTELFPAVEKVKCTLCDKTDSGVCPMKEFLKTSLTSTIQQSKYVSSVAMRSFVETSLANLIRQSDFISSCSGVFGGFSSLESVSIPSFYVQHPGMFAPNPTVPLYGPFNPAWCYPPDVPVRGQNCFIPSFKKEERSRPNERSDEAESGKRKNRSRSRSSLRKSDMETSSRRASGSPTQRQSDSKRTDSSDSSYEESEVGEGGKKRRLRGRGSLQDEVNPKKKVKEFNLRSKRHLSSESSCEEPESQEKRSTQLGDLPLGGKCGKPEKKTHSPSHPKMSSKKDVPLKKMRSKEERTVVDELPARPSLVEDRGNVRTVEPPSNWEENPASAANDPPLLLPAVTEQSLCVDSSQVTRDEEESLLTVPPNGPPVLLPAVTEKRKREDSLAVPANNPPRLIPAVTKDSSQVTGKQRKPQFSFPADSPPVLLPAVKEKSQDSSLPTTNTQDEPHFAVPTRRPPRANNKNKQFEKNLRPAKSAIALISGGFGNDIVTESDKIESVGSAGSDISFVDVGEDHPATVPVLSDHPTWKLKRYNTRSVITSAPVCSEEESRVSTLKSTVGENASITQDVKSPKKGKTPSPELKSLRKAGTFDGPLVCPELRVIGNDEKVRSPVKSPLHVGTSLAVLEDDLCLSEDSDSDVEISPDKVTEVCHDNVEEGEGGDQTTGEREAAVEVFELEDSVSSQGRNREVGSHGDSQAKENAFDVCEKEEMDLSLVGPDKEVDSVGTLLQEGEDLEKEQEGVLVEVEAKSQEGDSSCPVAEEQDDSPSPMAITHQSKVDSVEESNELSVRVDEQESNKVEEVSEHINVLQESGDLNQLDAAVISALVEVFPDDKLSVEDLGNHNAAALSSVFSVSNSEEASGFGVTTQPLTENVQFTVAAETTDSCGESGTKLFDDVDDSDKNPCDVDEEMLKSEVKDVKVASDASEISGSVFGSLFEDLTESDPNLSGVGDLVASVLPDLSDVESPQMVIELQEGDMAVSGEASPAKESTVIPNGNDTACAKRDNDTVVCVPSDGCLTPLENAADNRNRTTKEVPTAPKRHIPVVAPTGPYRTRRASRVYSNQKNPSASATSIQKAETSSDDTQTSGRRLRSRTGAKPVVVDKKKKFASRQFISSDSSSESDAEKLVIAEEGQPSGRMSPKDSTPEKSKDSTKVENGESSPIGTRTRMKRKSSPLLCPTLPAEKRWYSTRASTGSRTSESDVNSEPSAEGMKPESVLGSDESSKNSPSPNVRPKSRESGRVANLEPTRRSSRRRTKPRRWSESDESSPEKEDESPSDAVKEVVSVASKTTTAVILKRASKLEKLRKNLSKGHPLLQPIAHRSDVPPVKKVKVETEDEPESADGKSKFGTSSLMPKSGRTVCLLPSDPKNLRKRHRPKDPLNPTVQSGNSATVFTKPRITPRERLAALRSSANTVEPNSKDVKPEETTPNNLSPRSASPTSDPTTKSVPTSPKSVPTLPKSVPTLPKSVPTSPKIAPADKTALPVQSLAPSPLKETSLQSSRMNSLKETLQPTITEANPPIFKRSNSIRKLAANRPAVLAPSVNSSVFSPREETASSCTRAKPEVPEFTSNAADLSSGRQVPASCSPDVSELSAAPIRQHSSDGAASGRAKRSDIWVLPAMEIEQPTSECRLKMGTPKEKELVHVRPVSNEQSVVRGRDLIAVINSTSPGDVLSSDLVMDDRHPLLIAWKRRGSTVVSMRQQQADLDRGMAESVPAIKKLLNAYWASSDFTEELLTHTVNSLLNPKYICMDIIVSRLLVEMVEVDFDSEPCVGSSCPGRFLTIIQQKLIALVMRLLPSYRNIVRDVLLLIEFHTYRLNQAPESGRLQWLAVLHTAICRIMKWRDLSLIFCYDAMYCFVSRYSTVLNCVFQVWPELLPSIFDKSKTGSIFQVMTHFTMTQGEPDKNSDLKALRSLFVSKRAYSGDTNSSALTQSVIQNIKDGKCGPISPALILISKREDIPWSQDKIVNQHLLPIIRDWLLSCDDVAHRSLPPAAVSTLCGIVRAFRGTESSVSATHTLMKTLLLDTKAVSASPDLEVAASAGWVYLTRHNIEFVVNVLKKWQPKNRCPEWLIQLLTDVMNTRARPPHWWAKEIGNLLVSSEPFPHISKVCM